MVMYDTEYDRFLKILPQPSIVLRREMQDCTVRLIVRVNSKNVWLLDSLLENGQYLFYSLF